MAAEVGSEKIASNSEAALDIFPLRCTPSINCLEAMRAQSPPKVSLGKDSDNFLSQRLEEEDDAYALWQVDYPSAVQNFEKFEELVTGKKVAVFLDYDGTLSPIVEDPSKAYMSEEMRSVVQKVSAYFPTAIVSGRAREKVYNFVQLEELLYAGSHGMDIKGPTCSTSSGSFSNAHEAGKDGRFLSLQPAEEFYPLLNEVFDKLMEASSCIEGALVENNKFCISVHFRRVKEKDWDELANITMDLLKNYSKLRTTHGRKVLEIRPAIDWDKGKALAYLLEELGLDDRSKVFPLYIGDDRTDEDAFKVLREKQMGCGILVSTKPRESDASLSLRDPSEVNAFLERLVEWKESQTNL